MKTLLKRIFGKTEPKVIASVKPEVPPLSPLILNLELFFAHDGEVFRTERQRTEYEQKLIQDKLLSFIEDQSKTKENFGYLFGVSPRCIASFIVNNYKEIQEITKELNK